LALRHHSPAPAERLLFLASQAQQPIAAVPGTSTALPCARAVAAVVERVGLEVDAAAAAHIAS